MGNNVLLEKSKAFALLISITKTQKGLSSNE